ncbi:fructosamine kinase family protein [Qipengyuania sp. XHP0207]|uniref:fructosamine kinase family protein n=1 Tax=Qipengyuania sp. XHP0207 TaxID=3038078 RepID=UPI00241DC277|nr:fructosamine kinase family protein [Qipengyuania sp. XHP0207]MDG5748535.1 fructosamine kinase family protein [Qipengyuania sp. XHP0207]
MGEAAAIGRLCGSPVTATHALPGGDISGASKITLADGRIVVAKHGPMVETEGRMLAALAECGAPVPKVIGIERGTLIIDYVGPSAAMRADHWSAVAAALDTLRDCSATDYGWSEDYALRNVVVSNMRTDNWVEFWRDNRLLCGLDELPAPLAQRVERLAGKLRDLIPSQPPASLVHGDLWGGNIVANPDGRIWLIDPCAYHGDREVDVAAMTVFDNPPSELFNSLALEPGWRERLPVYRLWMWLTHVRLFGEGYRPAAESDLERLGF